MTMVMNVVRQPMLPTYRNCEKFFPNNPSLEDELRRLFVNLNFRPDPIQPIEDVWDDFRHNGQDYEYCPDLDITPMPTVSQSRKKNKKPLPSECVFCKNNGEDVKYYRQHLLKDVDGRVTCPVLRAYTCPICGASGDDAHTIKYCSHNKNMPANSAPMNTLKVMRNSTGRRRSK